MIKRGKRKKREMGQKIQMPDLSVTIIESLDASY